MNTARYRSLRTSRGSQSIVLRLYLASFATRFNPAGAVYAIMFRERGGLSAAAVSLVFVAWTLAGVVFELPTGLFADRFPRKVVLILATSIITCEYLIWIVWPNFAGFVTGSVLSGIGAALWSGAFQAYVFDELDKAGARAKFDRVYGRAQGMQLFGLGSAYVLTLIIGPQNYVLVLWASVVAGLAGVITCMNLPLDTPRKRRDRKTFATLARDTRTALIESPSLRRLLIVQSLLGALMLSYLDFTPLYYNALGISVRVIPAILILSLAISVVIAWFTHRVSHVGRATLGSFLAVPAVLYLAGTFAHSGLVFAVIGQIALIRGVIIVDQLYGIFVQHAISTEARATLTSVAAFTSRITAIGIMLAFSAVSHHASGSLIAYRLLGMIALGVALAAYATRLRPNPASRAVSIGEALSASQT